MYKVVEIKMTMFGSDKKLEEQVNNTASEGWELVTITFVAGIIYSVWKKK